MHSSLHRRAAKGRRNTNNRDIPYKETGQITNVRTVKPTFWARKRHAAHTPTCQEWRRTPPLAQLSLSSVRSQYTRAGEARMERLPSCAMDFLCYNCTARVLTKSLYAGHSQRRRPTGMIIVCTFTYNTAAAQPLACSPQMQMSNSCVSTR